MATTQGYVVSETERNTEMDILQTELMREKQLKWVSKFISFYSLYSHWRNDEEQ